MITSIFSATLLAFASQAATPALSQENKAMVRCAAAISIVAHGQSIGNAEALKWPNLDVRGKEFFVRSLAQVMDDTGLDRAGVSQLVSTEAQSLWDKNEVDKVMPSCLLMLDASGV